MESDCEKTWFVKMFAQDWQAMSKAQKTMLVYEVLSRIDPKRPGKIKPLDYQGTSELINKYGANWFERTDLPDLLTNPERSEI